MGRSLVARLSLGPCEGGNPITAIIIGEMHMKITDDVILDLLPLYQSGEASEDSCLLVESYLQQHPELAQMIDQTQLKLEALAAATWQDTQVEKKTLKRVKQVLRLRSILFGVALFFSVMPLASAGNSEQGLVWLMIRDWPGTAVFFILLALITWGLYYWTLQALSDKP